MREHKYRGKASETGQWVYGDLITIKPPAIIPVLSDYQYPCIWNTTGIWPVDPETVGQFIGLKDEGGNDIYEGDILKCVKNCLTKEGTVFHKVEFKYGSFRIENNVELEIITSSFRPLIIGNIYENPDLIK